MTNTLNHTVSTFLKQQAEGFAFALANGAPANKLSVAERHILQISKEIESGKIPSVEEANRIADERIKAEFKRMDETVDA